ncbi:hypothetical protein TVAG_347280 [Trichomonas vaginalis G3]|uniref:BZIP domain-containing protein n=1 Tax=Trichomonas vaginalis (strain ATCC PRA-98 / G3) TaxID=412133 RepID=A2FSH4_TRIV3|nr:hypothetical protein TVAGG3_0714940 [Trichomonas vaginalis G3]EAX92145.1 hypothetical protein TVAG_347280 [Trichomonas vaginalis G3]KAI5510183.1 hypothetical protein TVAGG3_0714940 [Trichomonas vaginalis G3]|eukprot:XP_001305075.1 hypothetical protein [Trichomonas vaginalis G3]
MTSVSIPGALLQQQIPMLLMPKQQQHTEQTSGLPTEIEKKTQDLILMTGDAGPRRWRKTKTDYLKKLETDNGDLKSLVVELQQQISGLQAQNEILRDQLRYFQSCLSQAAPLVFQPNANQESK